MVTNFLTPTPTSKIYNCSCCRKISIKTTSRKQSISFLSSRQPIYIEASFNRGKSQLSNGVCHVLGGFFSHTYQFWQYVFYFPKKHTFARVGGDLSSGTTPPANLWWSNAHIVKIGKYKKKILQGHDIHC